MDGPCVADNRVAFNVKVWKTIDLNGPRSRSHVRVSFARDFVEVYGFRAEKKELLAMLRYDSIARYDPPDGAVLRFAERRGERVVEHDFIFDALEQAQQVYETIAYLSALRERASTLSGSPSRTDVSAGPEITKIVPRAARAVARNRLDEFRLKLQHWSCSEWVATLDAFTRQFHTSPPPVDQQGDHVRRVITKAIESLHQNPLFHWRDGDEWTELQSVDLMVEREIMARIYIRALHPDGAGSERSDQEMSARITALRFVRPDHLDLVLLDHADHASLASAAEELQGMSEHEAPCDKVTSLLNACQYIYAILAASGRPAGADEFLPWLIIALLRANPGSLRSNIAYLQRFLDRAHVKAEAGYYLTQLSAAESFITHLTAADLSIDEDEFNRRLRSDSEHALLNMTSPGAANEYGAAATHALREAAEHVHRLQQRNAVLEHQVKALVATINKLGDKTCGSSVRARVRDMWTLCENLTQRAMSSDLTSFRLSADLRAARALARELRASLEGAIYAEQAATAEAVAKQEEYTRAVAAAADLRRVVTSQAAQLLAAQDELAAACHEAEAAKAEVATVAADKADRETELAELRANYDAVRREFAARASSSPPPPIPSEGEQALVQQQTEPTADGGRLVAPQGHSGQSSRASSPAPPALAPSTPIAGVGQWNAGLGGAGTPSRTVSELTEDEVGLLRTRSIGGWEALEAIEATGRPRPYRHEVVPDDPVRTELARAREEIAFLRGEVSAWRDRAAGIDATLQDVRDALQREVERGIVVSEAAGTLESACRAAQDEVAAVRQETALRSERLTKKLSHALAANALATKERLAVEKRLADEVARVGRYAENVRKLEHEISVLANDGSRENISDEDVFPPAPPAVSAAPPSSARPPLAPSGGGARRKIRWLPDSATGQCMRCTQDFTITRRRHHCRACGHIFCSDCSSRSMPVPGHANPVRVCEHCFAQSGADRPLRRPRSDSAVT